MTQPDKEMKIALVIDSYKLPKKDAIWAKALRRKPEIERNYEFVKEDVGPGLTPNTTIVYRWYRLKGQRQ